ncbi:hypothetical protein BT93_D2056 [Corymbia citriodora subsp. variegata]|nr:hypothetical protein BT93_D2056 [Corymbia citriodora subsp. variegata]
MASNMPILFLSSIFFFFLLAHLISPQSETCPPTNCGPDEPTVQFPFGLEQSQSIQRCVYPGFDLSCNSQGRTTLKLPTSGEFIVEFIDYINQNIWLSDPGECLLGRLQNFTHWGTNWIVQNSANLTLYKCPKGRRYVSMLPAVPCLDGQNYTVVVVAVDELSKHRRILLSIGCRENGTMAMPTVDYSYQSFDELLNSQHSFGLMWAEPSCGSCAALGGSCGFKEKTGLEINCTISHGPYGVRLFF